MTTSGAPSPAPVPPSAPVPLDRHVHVLRRGASARTLLLLHGTGGDEHDLLRLGGMLDPEATLLSPRGNVSEAGMARFFRRVREGVFDEDDVRRRSAELGGWVRAALAHYGLDPAGVTAVGFSNGANVAAAMMLLGAYVPARTVLLRAMVPIAPSAGVSLRGARVLVLAGTSDPIVPAEHSQRLSAMLRGQGAEVDLREVPGGHGLTREDVDLARAWMAR